MSSSNASQDFIVRVPKINDNEVFSVINFSKNLNVDPTQWQSVDLHREDNSVVYKDGTDVPPVSGAGSEYGKANRDMARRKRRGYRVRNYNPDDQPWLLNVRGAQDKHFKGTREGGISNNADYWVFVKSEEGVFDAVPVKEWYKFLPIARYKTLNADEAEEQFKRRTNILNQFALKANLKLGDRDVDEKPDKSSLDKQFKIVTSDRESDGDGSDKEGEAADTEAVTSKKIKSKKTKASKKRLENNPDEVKSDDSDDGDDEGEEVDYMTDSDLSGSSISDLDELVQKELIGVNDETTGVKEGESDNEDEEEEEKDDDDEKSQPVEQSQQESLTSSGSSKKKHKDDDSSSGSDSDADPDKEEIKSAIFLRFPGSVAGATTGRPGSPSVKSERSSTPQSQKGSKRPATSGGDAPESKKPKSAVKAESSSGITESDVRRYLQRKPLSTKELVAKFRSRCANMPKQEIVTQLAQILKKLEPKQTKDKTKGVMVFSL